MTNKEKAYDEALERAKKYYSTTNSAADTELIELIFPELKGSDDEKVRKTIIRFFKDQYSNETEMYDGSVTVGKAIAWLEKQSKQKPILDFKASDWYVSKVDGKIHNIYYSVDKVEPKFKVGDTVKDPYGEVYHIVEVNNDSYKTDDRRFILFENEDVYSLWTIQDAKDGDVLAEDTCIFIIEKMNPNGTAIVHCCLFDDGEFDSTGSTLGFAIDSTKPATKEQRDFLFKKMKEAGYEWDAEKKELKLLITNGGDFFESENCEQKHADTVEQKCEESKTKIFDAPTPFEDKLYAFVLACEILVDPSKREFILEHSQEILDAAREQIGKEQKSAWSEEDEKMLADACIMLDWYHGNNWWKAQHIKNWLKALKQRCAWKPSDEQMATLYKYAEQNNYDGSILTSLYNDLKKLREE
jgi:hypothetical protein